MRSGSPENDVKQLLDWLCIQWGFCIPPKAAQDICQRSELTADEFANLVLLAEEMDPEAEKEWFCKIRDRFIEQFGESVLIKRPKD